MLKDTYFVNFHLPFKEFNFKQLKASHSDWIFVRYYYFYYYLHVTYIKELHIGKAQPRVHRASMTQGESYGVWCTIAF